MLPTSPDVRRRSGFTLVELLIVILILSILISIALPLYNAAVADANKKAARTNMQIISTALTAWKVRTGSTTWPTGTMVGDLGNDIMGDIPGGVSGPGPRVYQMVTQSSCYTPSNATPIGTDGTVPSPTNIPSGSFAITDSNNGVEQGQSGATTDDWCYIPGVSTQ